MKINIYWLIHGIRICKYFKDHIIFSPFTKTEKEGYKIRFRLEGGIIIYDIQMPHNVRRDLTSGRWEISTTKSVFTPLRQFQEELSAPALVVYLP